MCMAPLELLKRFCLIFSSRDCWWKTETLSWNFVPEVHEVLRDPVRLVQHKSSLLAADSSSQRLAEQNAPLPTRPCYLLFQIFTVSSAFISTFIRSGEVLSAHCRRTELKQSEEFNLSLPKPLAHITPRQHPLQWSSTAPEHLRLARQT